MTTTANQYLPIVAWKTTVKDVVMLTSTTYRVTVSPIDINEPGAQLPILVGFYLKDFLGYTYRVSNINVGGIITNIELTDDFALGWGPQEGRIGVVYESVDLGTSPYLSPGKHKVLDLTALDYTRAFELDILWRNRYQYWTITPNALTPINVNSQTQIQFVDSSSVGWTITQVNSSLITVSAASVLPTASATVLGGIKIGAGLVITSGVASTLFTSLTTTGTGAATLVSGVLNIPTPSAATFVSLTTTGTSGAATLVGGVLNIPNYASSIPTITNDITSSALQYPLFSASSSGSLAPKTSSPNFTYSPLNGTLTVTGSYSGNSLYVTNYIQLWTNTGQILLGTSSNAGVTGQVLTSGGTSGGVSWTTISGSPLITSLTTTGTSGAATLISGVLNIPNYATGSGIALTNLSVTNTGISGNATYNNTTGVFNIPNYTISLTTTGTSGAATLISGVLNIPNYATGSSISLTTTGTGAATLISGVLNIPTPSAGTFVSLTTTGTGAATLVGGVLNIPTPGSALFTSLTTTGTSGAATLVGGVLNIPNYAGGGSMTYPSAGIALSTGTSGPWGTSLSTSGGGLQIVSNVLGIAYPSAGLVASSGSAWSAVTIGTGLTYTGGILAASGAMTYPPAGLPLSTGTAWGSSFDPAGHSGMTLIVAGASGGEHWAWYAPTPLTDDIEFEFRDINPTVSQIYILDISASWAYNVTSLFLQTDPGCTITITSVSIAGTAIVWGGSIIAPGSASILSIYPISGYTAYIGNQVTIVTSGVSTGYPVSLRGKLTRQRL